MPDSPDVAIHLAHGEAVIPGEHQVLAPRFFEPAEPVRRHITGQTAALGAAPTLTEGT